MSFVNVTAPCATADSDWALRAADVPRPAKPTTAATSDAIPTVFTCASFWEARSDAHILLRRGKLVEVVQRKVSATCARMLPSRSNLAAGRRACRTSSSRPTSGIRLPGECTDLAVLHEDQMSVIVTLSPAGAEGGRKCSMPSTPWSPRTRKGD